MYSVYANLLGNWTDISTEGLVENVNPSLFFQSNSLTDLKFVNIKYRFTEYQISTSYIQLVHKSN